MRLEMLDRKLSQANVIIKSEQAGHHKQPHLERFRGGFFCSEHCAYQLTSIICSDRGVGSIYTFHVSKHRICAPTNTTLLGNP